MHSTENLFVFCLFVCLFTVGSRAWIKCGISLRQIMRYKKQVLKINFHSLSFTFILNKPLWKVKSRFHCVILLASGLEEEWKSHGF